MQSYAQRQPLIIGTKRHVDERGSLRKFFPLEERDFPVREVFTTTTNRDGLRGLAAQTEVPQAKLIQVLSGSLSVNMVNLDPTTETFGRVVYLELSAEDDFQVLVPELWGLGYRALEDATRVLYLANAPHSAATAGVHPLSEEFYWGEGFTPALAEVAQKDLQLPLLSTFIEAIERGARA